MSVASSDMLIGRVVAEKYKLTKRLGSGVYGVVYEARDHIGCEYAVKFETATRHSRLHHEHHVYYTLHNPNTLVGIPVIFYYQQDAHYIFLVMEKLGRSIGDDPDKPYSMLSMRDTMRAGRDLMSILSSIHAKGYLHLDLKPSNIVFNTGHSRYFVSILDFGLAEKYIDPNTGMHIAQREERKVRGPLLYASKNTHAYRSRSRRDDLEMVGYSLISVCIGTLPWQNIKTRRAPKRMTNRELASWQAQAKLERFDDIGDMKRVMKDEDICVGMPDEMRQYLEYVSSLSYAETPNYTYLKSLFVAGLRNVDAQELIGDF